MKTMFSCLFCTLFFCSAFLFKVPQSDFRDAYTGQYFCNRNSVAYNFNGQQSVVSDTVTIDVIKAAEDSILKIVLSKTEYRFKLRHKKLKTIGSPRGTGKFYATDSLMLYIPVGRMMNVTYSGKKKN